MLFYVQTVVRKLRRLSFFRATSLCLMLTVSLLGNTGCDLLSTDQLQSITPKCEPGAISLPGACAKLCETDSECPHGFICGLGNDNTPDTDSPGNRNTGHTVQTTDSVASAAHFLQSTICFTGQRVQPPRIDSIDGDGTQSDALNETAHHLAHGIIVTGDYFTGADVALDAPNGPVNDITVIARTPQRLEIALPITVTDEGVYRLHVRGQAGTAQQSFLIMRGETGATGFPGANDVTRVVLFATTDTTNNTTPAISIDNPDNQISSSFHFPSAPSAGILLAAVRRSDHTLLDSPFAGNWFNNSNTLLVTLNSLAEDAFVIMASRGDVSSWLQQANGTETALGALLRQFGAMPGMHLLASNESFVFVGRNGMGSGNGVFIVGPGSTSTALTLADADLIGASTHNYGICLRDNTNCTIPASHIVGVLTPAQLPGGLAGLTSNTNSNGVISISTPLTLDGNVSITGNTPTCTMSLPGWGNATTAIWNSANALNNDFNNQCYGIFTTPTGSTPKTWFEAQLACNAIGAHLATFTPDTINTGSVALAQTRANNELAFVASKLTGLPNNTSAWIGISNYEGAVRWVGAEGAVGNAPVTLATGAGTLCGAITSATTGSSPTQKPLTGTTYACTATTPTAFVCERPLTPFAQPCALGWWPINGGRICMEASMRPAATYRTASATCQKNSVAAARVCSTTDMFQACGAGINVYSSGATSLTPVAAGWTSDHPADDAFGIWNANVCTDNNDGPPQNGNSPTYPYRCCY